MAVQYFLRVVFDLAPDFSSFWINTIQNIDDEHQRPDLYAAIDRFRIHRQILGVESRSTPRAAFGATLQGQQQEERPRTPCVCGKYHRYSQCWYLDDSIAPTGWQENPTIRKTVQDQLKKPEKKAAVDRALQRKKESNQDKQEEKKEIQHQSFATTTNQRDDEFPLRQSFILDSGADVHVCNDLSRATGPIRLTGPGERLVIGSGWILIVGYGDIEVKARAPAPRNQQIIKLKDVAFIPSFFTNVVSLKKLIKGGIE
jgi:hypothetical protein